MNRSDIILVTFVILLGLILFILNKPVNGELAKVYHDSKLIKEISLSKNGKYVVDGDKGKVYIQVKNNKIKVTDETSPLHLCQNKEINKAGESIICLPNKIIIKIENNELDGIVGD